MKKLTSILCAFNFALIQAIGFGADSLVTTESGRLKPIKDLTIGERVVCYSKNFEPVHSTIKGISAFTVESVVLITTENNDVIVASHLERFFLPQEGAWVYAQFLKKGDCLLNNDLEPVAISYVQQCSEPQELYSITVDQFHNFLISEGQYLVHNGLLAASQAYWATKTMLYAALGLGVAGTLVATGGAVAAASTAVYAGTATVGTVVNGVSAGIASAAVGAASCGSTMSAATVGTATAFGAIAGGTAEAGMIAGAYTAGGSAIMTVAGSTAGATGAAGICAATAAAIETTAIAAFMTALTCPWTPW